MQSSFEQMAIVLSSLFNIEQTAIVLSNQQYSRFVDSLFQIREEFLGFVACQKGLSTEVLAKKITDFIQSIGLHMDDWWSRV